MSVATVLLLVFGGALAIEGIAWALAPDAMRRAYDQAMSMLDGRSLANMGLLSAALGLLLIWIGIRLHS
ncbi:DUF2065 family protein [uncultured Algimonas sp.]|uniref:DUF2065 family protein n=1 Tax=uncultured Algimonas sp. TaxID=1547920 RepID=UPI00262176C1|nr:DUF2065 family protein [uncultured Algimonas sp.]